MRSPAPAPSAPRRARRDPPSSPPCTCRPAGRHGPGRLCPEHIGAGRQLSGSWGFSSASDQSVKLNQAAGHRQAERGADPTTQYYTTNTYNTDNRSNYSQTDVTGDGPVTIDVVGGNKIGQQTYSVGSLNTGSTEITVMGDGNLIDANNSATTTGCVDGSISEMSFLWTPTDGSAGRCWPNDQHQLALGHDVRLHRWRVSVKTWI